MTPQELKEFEAALKSFRKEHMQTREQARKVLRDEGVIDEHGNLTKPYRRATEKRAKAS